MPPELLLEDKRGRRGLASHALDVEEDADPPYLNAKKNNKVELVKKEAVSHNVTRFTFALDRPDRLLGLPTGKHMLIRKAGKNKEGKEEMVMRAYTPTTADETRGHFELVVKIYYANQHPRFPDGGRFSQVRAATLRCTCICCWAAACFLQSPGPAGSTLSLLAEGGLVLARCRLLDPCAIWISRSSACLPACCPFANMCSLHRPHCSPRRALLRWHDTRPRVVQILQDLEVGDFVEVRGPIGHFEYTRPGHFVHNRKEGRCNRINMIAGGTGITPMYQVMKRILSDENDTTALRLLYANQTEDDILVRHELETLAAARPERCAL